MSTYESVVSTLDGWSAVWAARMWPAVYQAAILAVIVFAVTRFRWVSSPTRFWLWMLVPLRLLVMPVLTIALPVLPGDVSSATSGVAESQDRLGAFVEQSAGMNRVIPVLPAHDASPPPTVADVEDGAGVDHALTVHSIESKAHASTLNRLWAGRPSALALLMLAWGVGVILSGVRLCRAWRRVRQVVTTATGELPDTLNACQVRVATMLGIRRLPRIRVTHENVGPFVFGVWRPTIVIPDRLIAALSAEQLEAVLVHEMAHLRRWDQVLG